jgi:hypothetical protein
MLTSMSFLTSIHYHLTISIYIVSQIQTIDHQLYNYKTIKVRHHNNLFMLSVDWYNFEPRDMSYDDNISQNEYSMFEWLHL